MLSPRPTPRPMRRASRFAAVGSLALFLAGCVVSSPPAAPLRDATASFIRDPEFPAAVRAAPHLLPRILSTVTAYEAELQTLAAQRRK